MGPALTEGVPAFALILGSEANLKDSESSTELLKMSLEEPLHQMKSTLMNMNNTADHFRSSATSANGVLEEFRDKCHQIISHLSLSADDLVVELGLAITDQPPTAQTSKEGHSGTQPLVMYQ